MRPSINDPEFVDAVSGPSLSSEKKDYFRIPKSDTRRSGLGLILVGSIARNPADFLGFFVGANIHRDHPYFSVSSISSDKFV